MVAEHHGSTIVIANHDVVVTERWATEQGLDDRLLAQRRATHPRLLAQAPDEEEQKGESAEQGEGSLQDGRTGNS